MIQLQTSTGSSLDIFSGYGFAWSPLTAPDTPADHMIVTRITLLSLAQPVARNITVNITTSNGTKKYTDFESLITTTASGQAFVLNIGPFIVDNSGGLRVWITSDNSGDTAAGLTCEVFSADMEYYFAYRAAEASPTADSVIERIKTTDDAVPLISTSVPSDVWAVATRVLTAATNLNIPTSDQNATANWVNPTRTLTTPTSDVWSVTARTLTADTNINYPSSDAIADAVLSKSVSDVQDVAAAHSLTTVVLATTESGITSDAWTIRKTDGTPFVVKTVTSDASANPVTNVT